MPRITNFTPLHTPIRGIVNGTLVTCEAYGDVEGNSPSLMYSDPEGRLQWVSFEHFRAIDNRATGAEVLRGLTMATR